MSNPYSGAPATQAPPSPIVIGLDLSLTSTGLAIVHNGRATVTRVTSKPTGSTTADQLIRLRVIVSRIRAAIPASTRTVAAVEGPAFGANDPGAHIRGGLWWMVREMLDAEDIDVVVVTPATLKKYATGKGNAAKDAVLAAAVRRFPDVDVTGNDEADALWLAAIRARIEGQPIDELPAVQVDATKGVTR